MGEIIQPLSLHQGPGIKNKDLQIESDEGPSEDMKAKKNARCKTVPPSDG